ncbi:hypothetical protein Tco_1372097 [Tanacetum coccineum]
MRCRDDSPMWCREMMVHLTPPVAQEENNCLTTPIALERAWFSLARAVMAQAEILQRIENLQDDYSTLPETHEGCSNTVRKLVTARQDLEHNSNLYTNMSNRFKELKDEHSGCDGNVKALGKERDELSIANQNQVGWGNGLSLSQTDDEILAVLKDTSNFDAYSNKKLYPIYNKLFEDEYLFVMKIASGYRHSVTDLLKVHPDPAPVGGSSAPAISSALADPPVSSSKKKI